MENMDNNQKSSLRQKVTERLSGKIRTQSTLGYSIFKDKVLVEIALKPLSQQQLSNSHGFVPRQTLLSCFLQLPPELQLEILSYLDFGDIQRLRQTSRLFRESLDHGLMKSLFPRLFEDMLKTCYICLTEGVEHLMIMGNARHQRYPLTSKCFSCIERQAGFMVGRRYTLVNSETVFVCRWCGIPVTSVMESRGSDFHSYCYEWYKGALVLHHTIGVVQWMVVIVGSALCWHYFIRQTMVTIPLALAFVIGFWPIILNMTRGHAMRTYHWSMITELIILTLWIPPMYAIINKAIVNRSTSGLHVSQPATSATLVFIVFNM
ncbi:hypothetical protein TrVGV298_009969 [Trichoderma virens]|nr:hypothetical protein TrVGV298_009969 [Trichoderma virens]